MQLIVTPHGLLYGAPDSGSWCGTAEENPKMTGWSSPTRKYGQPWTRTRLSNLYQVPVGQARI